MGFASPIEADEVTAAFRPKQTVLGKRLASKRRWPNLRRHKARGKEQEKWEKDIALAAIALIFGIGMFIGSFLGRPW